MRVLAELVATWDRDFEASLSPQADSSERRPFARVLDSLKGVRSFRFEPYKNDTLPNFIEKLTHWVQQFNEGERPAAFLLASRFVFVTDSQFQALLRRLFCSSIRRYFLESIISTRALGRFQYAEAIKWIDQELDNTIFVPNSESSPLNAFVHSNDSYFRDRIQRALVGPELSFWTHSSKVANTSDDPDIARAARTFQMKVVRNNPLLRGKHRLIVLEDFAGTGSDLAASLKAIDQSVLDIQEVGIAVALATQAGSDRLSSLCERLTARGPRSYHFWAGHVLPQTLRCFDSPVDSYLDRNTLIPDLSKQVKAISERLYRERYYSFLAKKNRHGYGGLALAFAMYSNCPDNSLPMLWTTNGGWHPLYRRVSRFI